MDWPIAEELCALWSLPDVLTRADIPVLIESINHWHPDIAVGVGSCYLREDFYTEKVCLDGQRERDVIVVLTKYGDELVALGSWEREQNALTLYGDSEPSHPSTAARNWRCAPWSSASVWRARWGRDSSMAWRP